MLLGLIILSHLLLEALANLELVLVERKLLLSLPKLVTFRTAVIEVLRFEHLRVIRIRETYLRNHWPFHAVVLSSKVLCIFLFSDIRRQIFSLIQVACCYDDSHLGLMRTALLREWGLPFITIWWVRCVKILILGVNLPIQNLLSMRRVCSWLCLRGVSIAAIHIWSSLDVLLLYHKHLLLWIVNMLLVLTLVQDLLRFIRLLKYSSWIIIFIWLVALFRSSFLISQPRSSLFRSADYRHVKRFELDGQLYFRCLVHHAEIFIIPRERSLFLGDKGSAVARSKPSLAALVWFPWSAMDVRGRANLLKLRTIHLLRHSLSIIRPVQFFIPFSCFHTCDIFTQLYK